MMFRRSPSSCKAKFLIKSFGVGSTIALVCSRAAAASQSDHVLPGLQCALLQAHLLNCSIAVLRMLTLIDLFLVLLNAQLVLEAQQECSVTRRQYVPDTLGAVRAEAQPWTDASERFSTRRKAGGDRAR